MPSRRDRRAGYARLSDSNSSRSGPCRRQLASQSTLAFTGTGTVAYLLTASAQQHFKTLLVGQPRLVALHWLMRQQGIHTASISGVSDDQPLPDDLGHLHLLIVVPLS